MYTQGNFLVALDNHVRQLTYQRVTAFTIMLFSMITITMTYYY